MKCRTCGEETLPPQGNLPDVEWEMECGLDLPYCSLECEERGERKVVDGWLIFGGLTVFIFAAMMIWSWWKD